MDEPKENVNGDAGENPHIPEPPPIVPIPGFSGNPIKPSAFEERLQRIFLATHGLRPVWRFLLYLLMYRGLKVGLQILISTSLPDMPRIWLLFLAELGLAIIALAPALLMARLENRAFAEYGLPLPFAFGRRFWVGVVWGLLSLSALLLAMSAAGIFHIEGVALHGMRILKFAAFWAGFFLVVGLYEEFFIRGYTQFTLTQAVGFWPSAVLLSLGFGVLHLENPGETWIGILGAIAIGFFFCLTLRRTGNLWFAVGFHTSWDWGESYLYSVPDSGGVAPGHLLQASFRGAPWLTGGSVGPEGSIFLFLLLILLWMVFDRMYPEVKYPQAAVKETTEIAD
jgi:CAAX protease family protein